MHPVRDAVFWVGGGGAIILSDLCSLRPRRTHLCSALFSVSAGGKL